MHDSILSSYKLSGIIGFFLQRNQMKSLDFMPETRNFAWISVMHEEICNWHDWNSESRVSITIRSISTSAKKKKIRLGSDIQIILLYKLMVGLIATAHAMHIKNPVLANNTLNSALPSNYHTLVLFYTS